ncbi:GntR family transcriptional regulator [Sagittula sp. SSi028]|uniref:GntR family transcriptional regulator n=1 Tax=Sagittula sp. SSi028 TaxID=3400636 RepID=UPI003AF8C4FA
MTDATLSEQLANHLRRDILRGTLAPGAPVKERDHASALGVSRTPMREAIRILAQEGLLLLRPARSPVVADPSFADIAHNIEVMSGLERLSARLACARATCEDIEGIAALARQMEQDYDRADELDLFEMDMRFHRAIAEAAHNPVLAETHRALVARLWRARFLSATRKKARDRVLQQHAEIVAGLRARDADRVDATLAAHLERLHDNVRDYFKARASQTTGPDSAR